MLVGYDCYPKGKPANAFFKLRLHCLAALISEAGSELRWEQIIGTAFVNQGYSALAEPMIEAGRASLSPDLPLQKNEKTYLLELNWITGNCFGDNAASLLERISSCRKLLPDNVIPVVLSDKNRASHRMRDRLNRHGIAIIDADDVKALLLGSSDPLSPDI